MRHLPVGDAVSQRKPQLPVAEPQIQHLPESRRPQLAKLVGGVERKWQIADSNAIRAIVDEPQAVGD